MKFRIDDKIFEDFDKPFIGVVVASGINNQSSNPEIGKLLREAEKQLRKQFEGVEVSEHPYIVPWREAYRKFGSKPRDFRSSIEALSRIVLKGSEIRNINKLVDLYNLISIKYILPVGGEDLNKMKGDLILGYAKGDEKYSALGEEENDPPKLGEVIYKDDIGVICRRWNWREADRTKLTKDTQNTILVIESLSPIPQDIAEKSTKELRELVKKFCGGNVETFFLEEKTPEITFDF